MRLTCCTDYVEVYEQNFFHRRSSKTYHLQEKLLVGETMTDTKDDEKDIDLQTYKSVRDVKLEILNI